MYIKILVIISIFSLSGCITKPTGEKYSGKPFEVDSESALLVIYLEDDKKGIFGKEYRFSWLVTAGKTELATISNGTYFTYQLSSGVVELSAALLKGDVYFPTNTVGFLLDGIKAAQNQRNNKNIEFKPLHKMIVDKGEIYYLKWNVTYPRKIVWGGPNPIGSLEHVSADIGEVGVNGLSKALASGK